MSLELKVREPKVTFGPDSGNHVYLETELIVGVHLFGDKNMVLYDELRL